MKLVEGIIILPTLDSSMIDADPGVMPTPANVDEGPQDAKAMEMDNVKV